MTINKTSTMNYDKKCKNMYEVNFNTGENNGDA